MEDALVGGAEEEPEEPEELPLEEDEEVGPKPSLRMSPSSGARRSASSSSWKLLTMRVFLAPMQRKVPSQLEPVYSGCDPSSMESSESEDSAEREESDDEEEGTGREEPERAA